MPLYWLCYRHNNQISVVIEPGASIIHARLRASLDGLDAGRLLVAGNPVWTCYFAPNICSSPPTHRLRVVRNLRPLAGVRAERLTHRAMFIIPHGAPAGYEWVVALVVLVGLCFAVCAFMRSAKPPSGLRRKRQDLPAPNPVHPGPGPEDRLRDLRRRFHAVQSRKRPNPWRKRPPPNPWGTPNPWGKGPPPTRAECE